jgi:hypothetical protein
MDLYIYAIDNIWTDLKKLKPLSFNQICRYEEKYKLFLLIYYGHYDYIITNYNNIEIFNQAFFIATFRGNIKIMKYLYNLYKININYVDNINQNAYIIASIYGKIKTMKYLERLKINIYHKDVNGDDAYYIAIYLSKFNVIKYLEGQGYNIYNKNNYRKNVYIIALYYNKYHLLRHLESKETHLYLKRNIKTFYRCFNNRDKKFCRYKFNIGCFPYFLFILFIFGLGLYN